MTLNKATQMAMTLHLSTALTKHCRRMLTCIIRFWNVYMSMHFYIFIITAEISASHSVWQILTFVSPKRFQPAMDLLYFAHYITSLFERWMLWKVNITWAWFLHQDNFKTLSFLIWSSADNLIIQRLLHCTVCYLNLSSRYFNVLSCIILQTVHMDYLKDLSLRCVAYTSSCVTTCWTSFSQ